MMYLFCQFLLKNRIDGNVAQLENIYYSLCTIKFYVRFVRMFLTNKHNLAIFT